MNVQAEALRARAYDARRNGDTAGSIDAYQRAADLFANNGDPLREAHALRHIGDILRGESKIDEASSYYERAIALYEEHPERTDLDYANAFRGYALLLERLTRNAAAVWLRARILYEAAGVQAGVTECDEHIQQAGPNA